MKIDTQMQYKFAIESNKKDYNFTITASTEEEARGILKNDLQDIIKQL